jgi:hypothetical protein
LNHETGRVQFFQEGSGQAVGKHNPRDIHNDSPAPHSTTAVSEFLYGGTAKLTLDNQCQSVAVNRSYPEFPF